MWLIGNVVELVELLGLTILSTPREEGKTEEESRIPLGQLLGATIRARFEDESPGCTCEWAEVLWKASASPLWSVRKKKLRKLFQKYNNVPYFPLMPYSETESRNFQNWIMTRHSGSGEKFKEEQMDWLRMIRADIITSFHLDRDDLDMAAFDGKGGLGQMYKHLAIGWTV